MKIRLFILISKSKFKYIAWVLVLRRLKVVFNSSNEPMLERKV